MKDKDKRAERLRLALEMFEAGYEMMRQTLIRRFPDESEKKIQERLDTWLRTRECAPDGDATGRAIPLSRLGNQPNE